VAEDAVGAAGAEEEASWPRRQWAAWEWEIQEGIPAPTQYKPSKTWTRISTSLFWTVLHHFPICSLLDPKRISL
jgi:hypothetical protein